MSIDERLEKLTERHEALTQSIELIYHDHQQFGEYIRNAAQIAEANTKANSEHIDALVRIVGAQGENISALARVAEIHERRLTGLEG
jgi:hypothetical protein